MDYFIPSDSAPPLSILTDAFQVMPPAVARAAIEQHTQAGDVILDPFCAGVGVIRAALDLKRRVIAASFNPINVLAIAATLWTHDARAAFTHLADQRKGDARLQDHVLGLYTTACPTCERPATAQHFVWDRDQNAPDEKRVRCAACGESIGPIDQADLTRLQRFTSRGLPFWSLHGRATYGPQHEDAERVGEVIDAYTLRAQDAFNDILLKFQALTPDDQRALRPALLATLNACTSLHTPDESRYPSGLKPPARFVEKNVWLELEHQVAQLSLPPSGFPSIARAATLADLFASTEPAVCLLTAPARELIKQLPPQSVQLVVTHPPLPRPGFWALSTVWAAWLWGAEHIDHLLPLLSRKRTNWDWQWRALAAALKALQPALRDETRIAMSFTCDETALNSVALSAAGAQHVIEHAACDPFDGVRLTLQHAGAASQIDLAQTARHVLRARDEPTAWPVLHTALIAAWSRTEAASRLTHAPDGEPSPVTQLRDLVKAALAEAGAVEIEPHTWWLPSDQTGEMSLADRVEQTVIDLLRAQAKWRATDLLEEVYRRFADHLTPDRALVATAIHSYAEEPLDDALQLRAEDQPASRAVEMQEMSDLLVKIGQRLGYEARDEKQRAKVRVVWSKAGHHVFSFLVQTTAEIEALLRGSAGVLVIPGGRATLLQHKLAREARLHDTAWRVLKFSALRQAAQHEDLSEEVFHLAFGLQPPIDQPATQMKFHLIG